MISRPDRNTMIRIAIDEYFAAISAETIPEALAFFLPDATFTIYPSGRVFHGHSGIAEMYREVFGRHGAIRREVLDIACDIEASWLSASFRATASLSGDSGAVTCTVMHNVNFWQFSGTRFAAVKVFSSDPHL